MHDEHKSSVNAACNGDMDSKSLKEVLKFFETMAKNSLSRGNEWERTSQRDTTDVEAIKALTKQMVALSEQMTKVSMVSSASNSSVNNVSMCNSCGVTGHYSSTCPQVYEKVNA